MNFLFFSDGFSHLRDEILKLLRFRKLLTFHLLLGFWSGLLSISLERSSQFGTIPAVVLFRAVTILWKNFSGVSLLVRRYPLGVF